jgi:hypothetical protein
MFRRRTALFLALIGWFGISCHAVTISNIVDEISVGSYSNHLASLYTFTGQSRGFTDGPNPRVPTDQHDLARDYLVSNFTAWGYDTWLDPFTFTYTTSTYANANNVVAVKWGTGGTNTYIIGAHYDSVDSGQPDPSGGFLPNCPGANDNASGVAALLESAEAIKNYIFRDTLIFIAFDAEEKGFKGATHFVNNHLTDSPALTNFTTFLKSEVKAMVNLDTIAYNDTTPWWVVLGSVSGGTNPVSTQMASAFSKYTTLNTTNSSGYAQSDHKVFNEAGIFSVHLIEYDYAPYFEGAGQDPHSHKATDAIDTPGYIDFEYATEITRSIVGAVCDNAGLIAPATLVQNVASNTTTVSWISVPNVDYKLYGTSDLAASNGWTYIQDVPATNTATWLSIDIDLTSTTQRMFKVESE